MQLSARRLLSYLHNLTFMRLAALLMNEKAILDSSSIIYQDNLEYVKFDTSVEFDMLQVVLLLDFKKFFPYFPWKSGKGSEKWL